MGVSAVVVEHHMQLPTRVGRGHLLEERQELAVTVPREALVGHPPGGDFQRSKQGCGPMPDVVVRAPLGAARADRQARLGALQRLDLALFINADHDRLLGRIQVQPDHVADLGFQLRVGGELERLGLPGLEVVVFPHPGDGVVADPKLVGQQPGGPVGDPEVLGRRGEGGGQDLGAPVAADGLGPARPGLVAKAVQASLGVAAPPRQDNNSAAVAPSGPLIALTALWRGQRRGPGLQ